MWVQLTSAGSRSKRVFVNLDQVTQIYADSSGVTFVALSYDKPITVLESPEEILGLANARVVSSPNGGDSAGAQQVLTFDDGEKRPRRRSSARQ